MKPFLAYEKLAWVDTLLCKPEDVAEEASLYCRTIKESSTRLPRTLLHLGCGAGFHDHTFKGHFRVTGVDISRGMLKIARRLNPGIDYRRADMRSVRIGKPYDAVIIPESIGYMTTQNSLRRALHTASLHLNRSGVLLVVAHLQEEFRENNFAYSASKGNCAVTVFENNHILNSSKNCYEATMVYLIRRNGRLKIYTDRHRIGLFRASVWNGLLKNEGFSVKKLRLDHLYDRFLMEGGEYKQTVFVCVKR